jgi:hypothetical protein
VTVITTVTAHSQLRGRLARLRVSVDSERIAELSHIGMERRGSHANSRNSPSSETVSLIETVARSAALSFIIVERRPRLMSYTISVFMRGPSRRELEAYLRDRFTVALYEVDTGLGITLVGDVFGISVALYDPDGFDDDGELNFSAYPQVVAFTSRAGVMEPSTRASLCLAMARALALTAHVDLNAEFMIVENVQVLLESSVAKSCSALE